MLIPISEETTVISVSAQASLHPFPHNPIESFLRISEGQQDTLGTPEQKFVVFFPVILCVLVCKFWYYYPFLEVSGFVVSYYVTNALSCQCIYPLHFQLLHGSHLIIELPVFIATSGNVCLEYQVGKSTFVIMDFPCVFSQYFNGFGYFQVELGSGLSLHKFSKHVVLKVTYELRSITAPEFYTTHFQFTVSHYAVISIQCAHSI